MKLTAWGDAHPLAGEEGGVSAKQQPQPWWPPEKCDHEWFDTGLITLDGPVSECEKCGVLAT